MKRGGWASPAGRVTLSLTSIQQKHSTACPAHCAKEKQPSDSADGDGGGGGGGGGWASMLGRAELEEIHLLKDRDWRGGEIQRESV